MADSHDALGVCVQETITKVQLAVQPLLERYNDDAKSAGLDYLHVKNSMMLTYLIEMVQVMRGSRSSSSQDHHHCCRRLRVVVTALDKAHKLDKKLKYQIDKLLARGSSEELAHVQRHDQDADDPLSFRPDVDALEGNDADDQDDKDNDSGGEESTVDDDDDDDDLAAVRATVAMAQGGPKTKHVPGDNGQMATGLYQPPRQMAVPYPMNSAPHYPEHDHADEQELQQRRRQQQQRRRFQKLQSSELAATLQEYGGDDTPEHDDVHGIGQARPRAARQFARFEHEKTTLEEAHLVRFNVTRGEKKTRVRLQQGGAHDSNLATLTADLHDYDRYLAPSDTKKRQHGEGQPRDQPAKMLPNRSTRYANGRRIKEQLDRHGRVLDPSSSSSKRNALPSSNNALHAAALGVDGKSTKKKRRRK